MRRATRRTAFAVLAWGMTAGAAGAARARAPAEPSPVQGCNEFGLALYGRLRTEEGNLFFSPSSIHTALAMTYAGARGNTAAEMAKTLRYGRGEGFLAAYGRAIDRTMPGRDAPYELNIANALWLQQGDPFLRPFLDCNTRHFKAGLFEVDFRRQFEACRVRINKWVEGRTKEKIKDLLPRGSLDVRTRMVLTNAIYFKGDWASQFGKTATRDMDFHIAPARKIRTPMMFQSGSFGCTATSDLQAIRMPYRGGDLSMVVLLPKRADGLAEMEAALTLESLGAIVGRLRWPRKAHVYFPRFKMEYKMQMKPVLREMGMPDAFSRRSDFSGMNGRRDLYIDDVYHKAFVKVDEKGTEAAAATGVVIGVTSVGPSRPFVFKADHPFVFVIRHERTGMILFMGRVAKPAE